MHWDIVLEILFLLGIITFVFTRTRTMRVPEIRLLAEFLPGDVPAARDGREKELQAMEFRYAGDYDVSMTHGQGMTLRVYISEDGLHSAGIIDVSQGGERVSLIEFSTLLEPSGSITTSMGSHASVFSKPPDKIVAKVPWMNTSGEAFQLHEALCRAAGEEGYTARKVSRANVVSVIRASIRSDMEYQVRRGLYRCVAENQYKMTFLGAAIAVPLIWYGMCYGFLFQWYRPGKALLGWRLRRGLRKAARLRAREARTADEVEVVEEDVQDGGLYMPNITFDGPRIEDVSKKRELIRSVSEAAAKAYGLPKQAMVVVIRENAPENVGVGGELLADRVMDKAGPQAGAPGKK